MSLAGFIDEVEPADRTLAVVNRTAPRPLQTMLEGLFADQPVAVDERDLPDGDDDVVLLLEDGAVVAASPLAALEETILLVNSDLYRTGTRAFEEFAFPDVLAGLDDLPFHLRGYPESHKEKLLLIVVSRHIERRAWEAGGGTLRTSLQHLSRIEDERGTRAVYERLAASPVDVHLYGIPDWGSGPDFDVTVHGGYSEDFRRGWFVVHRPPDGAALDPAALVAYEVEPRTWEGFWTHDPGRVDAINGYVERTM